MGLSFKPNLSKIKWLIFGLLGLGALFFSNTLIVDASTNISTNEEHIYWQGRNLTTGQTEAYDWYYWPTYYDHMGQAYQSYEMIRIGALIHYPQSSGTYYVQVKYHTSWIVHDVGCMLWAGDIQNRTCNITKIDYDYNNNESWVTIDFFYESSSDYVELYLTFNDNTNIIVPHDDRIGFEYNSFINNPDGSSIIIGQNNTIINQNDTIINNQTEINESINDINDSLTDDDISGSLDTGNDFFDNFSIDDSRGFSAIVTAPIQFLRDLLTSSSSCQPLSISFNPNDSVHSGSANWSVPCGDILWSKAPSSIILLWDTIIWGLLGYRILIDLFKFINKMIDPEDKSEYIMKM